MSIPLPPILPPNGMLSGPPPPPPPPPLPGTTMMATGGPGGGNFHTVLVTHIPPHLSNSRALRDVAYPCGSTRGIYLACHTSAANKTNSTSSTGNSSSKSDSKSEKEKEEEKTQTEDDSKESKDQEAVALIRMATTHGANTITRILPMAVEGVKVFNCSSGAILRNVVTANFKLRQEDKEREELKEKLEKQEQDQTKNESLVGNSTEIAEIGEQIQDDNTADNAKAESDSKVNGDTVKDPNSNNDTKPSEEKLNTTETMTESIAVDSVDALPPMAQKLSEISKYLYGEYTSKPTVNTALLNVRPKSTLALPPPSTSEPSLKTTESEPTDDSNSSMFKLDVSKAAAAAGGGAYDEEADPLNAPEVLEAVAKFKKNLEERDTILRKRRMEIVEKKLKDAMIRARKRFEERKKEMELHAQQMQDNNGIQPPLPPPLPPNGEFSPPPPPPLMDSNGEEVTATAKESGKRMVSNLPAWMTKGSSQLATGTPNPNPSTSSTTDESNSNKRKFTPSDANYDPSTRRKQRIDTPDSQSISEIRLANQAADAAALAGDSKSVLLSSTEKTNALREWVSSKIVEYLGEEEVTLIDFIMNQTLQEESNPQEMLEEMQQVLDEDADDFVNDLYKKITELTKA